MAKKKNARGPLPGGVVTMGHRISKQISDGFSSHCVEYGQVISRAVEAALLIYIHSPLEVQSNAIAHRNDPAFWKAFREELEKQDS